MKHQTMKEQKIYLPRPIEEYKKMLEEWDLEFSKYKQRLDEAVNRLRQKANAFSDLVSILVSKNGNGKE